MTFENFQILVALFGAGALTGILLAMILDEIRTLFGFLKKKLTRT